MTTIEVTIPDDVQALLQRSRLGDRPLADQIRWALAVHLFQQGIISVGRAAEIAQEPRATFKLTLSEMGVPSMRCDVEDWDWEFAAIEQARRRRIESYNEPGP